MSYFKSLCAVVFCASLSTPIQAKEEIFTYQPSVMPELSLNGTHNVGVKTIEVVNPHALNLQDFTSKTDRKLTLEVWYPAQASNAEAASYDDVTRTHQTFSVMGFAKRDVKPLAAGKFPLVVLSHGYTGYRSIMYYLGEHLASHGYIVVSIDHTDSTNAEIDIENAPFAGFVSTLMNRSRDQQFVLESAASDRFFLKDIVDTESASVIGYSMGGYGAINTVGGCYDGKAEGLIAVGFPEKSARAMLPLFNFCNAGRDSVDPRWQAMVAFAPWGQEFNIHQAQSLADLKVPTLYVSGDQDDVSGFEQGVEKLFKQTNKKDNYLLVYENARHNIAPHPAPKIAYETKEDLGHYFEPSWNKEQLTRINEHMTLAFLDCHVKDQQSRCEYLPKQVNATQNRKADGGYTKPWLGFSERWAAGIKFYRAQ